MSGEARRSVSLRFVRMGERAPENVPANEVWLDVGNRVGPGVLDHHGGDTDVWSASALIMDRFQDLILDHVRDAGSVTLVLHASPDLDAICSAWLVRALLESGEFPEPRIHLDRIVLAVSENDQGFVRTDEPERCWPVVMRTLLSAEFASLSDEARTRKGCEVLDETLAELSDEGDLASAASQIITPLARAEIARARRDYREDLSRGEVFQVKLWSSARPWANGDGRASGPETKGGDRRSLTDAIFLEEPRSTLFKELARGDVEWSPMGLGFSLMVVSHSAGRSPGGDALYRHIISTDPFSGLHIRGLGAELERLEKCKEDERGGATLSGRERLGDGKGRHGYGVESPWYDGRGHDHTIVDSPSVTIDGKRTCASLLSPEEVLDAVWEYGDPAAFVSIEESELAIMCRAELVAGWEQQWPTEIGLPGVCPDLSEEVKQSLGPDAAGEALSIRQRGGNGERLGGFVLASQRLWAFPGGAALWVGRFESAEPLKNAKDFCAALADLRGSALQQLLPDRARLIRPSQAIHLVHVRVRPDDVDLGDEAGHHARLMHRMAVALPSTFRNRIGPEDLGEARRVLSRDNRYAMFATTRGVAVVSSRHTPLDSESDFHIPERLRAVVALAMGRRFSLDLVAESFARHRAEHSTIRAGDLILEDRWRLISVEQSLCFARVTEKRFGERVHDAISDLLGTAEQIHEAKQKVTSLAEHVRDARAAVYQRLTFLVSFLFAPLALATAFFSGIHMDREFVEKYHSFLPDGWEPAGWLLFLAFFLILCVISFVIWLFVRIGHWRTDVLRRLRKLMSARECPPG